MASFGDVIYAMGGKIYAVGRKNKVLALSSAEMYSPDGDGKWSSIAPMNEARCDASAAQLNGLFL